MNYFKSLLVLLILFAANAATAQCSVSMSTEVVPQYPYPESGDPLDAVLPNTAEYVRGSMLRPRAGIRDTAEFRCYCPTCSEEELTHLVEFKPELSSCVASSGTANWSGTVNVTTGGATTSNTISRDDPYLCLPKGRHTAEFVGSISANSSGATQTQTLTASPFPFNVDNILVVVLGDSYASGQGAPAARATASNWPTITDDQFEEWSRRERAERLEEQGAHVLALWQRRSFATLPIIDEGTRIRLGGQSWAGPVTSHFEAQRSPFATGSLAAMELEARSKDSSVTFINLAETGSTIDRGAINPGCVPETNCAVVFDGGQISRLSDLIGNRKIDHLFLGFGGNDAGFARVAAAYVMREPSLRPFLDYPSHREISEAVRSGVWSAVFERETTVAGLVRLPQEYHRLNSQLQLSLGENLSDAEVYLVEYPPVHKKRGPSDRTESFCEFFGRIAPLVDDRAEIGDSVGAILSRSSTWLGIIADPDNHPIRFRVDESEALETDKVFYRPLLREQKAAAERYGWRLVELSDEFLDHNICAGRPYPLHRRTSYEPTLPPEPVPGRWFRAGVEGFVIAGSASAAMADNNALLHPNEGGYAAMAKALLDTIDTPPTPAPAPGTWSAAINDIIDGQSCSSTNFNLPGCGPQGSACEPKGSACLAGVQDKGGDCRFSIRTCLKTANDPNADPVSTFFCGGANSDICAAAGGECIKAQSQGGSRQDICRFEESQNASQCRQTSSGIWTLASSNFARDFIGSVPVGVNGACITMMSNIGGTQGGGSVCSASNTSICAQAGGTCERAFDGNGRRHDLCRWAESSQSQCGTANRGLWTTANSSFANRWGTAVRSNESAACITQMRNIGGRER